jgi:hypothetical protein
MLKKWKMWLLVLVVLLSACSSNKESAEKSADMGSGASQEKSHNDSSVAKEDRSSPSSEENTAESIRDQRKVIYNADLRVSIENLQESMESVRLMAEEKGGYIVESNTSHAEEGYEEGMIIARIPMKEFRPFLKSVKQLSKGTPFESVQGKDVTEEYVDLSSRLKAKEKVRERLESFMAGAQRTEDLLKISSDLAKVQEEIEQIQGRLNFLKNQSDYSTVTVFFEVKDLKAEKLQTDELNTWKKTKKLFMETVNFLVSAVSFLFVGIIGLAPIWLIAILILLWLWRKRKNGQKKKPESPTSMT